MKFWGKWIFMMLAVCFIAGIVWNYWEDTNKKIVGTSQNEFDQGSIPYGKEIILEEIPELGYQNISDINLPDGYVCFDDLLILDGILYREHGGSYVKQEEDLFDLIGIEYLRYRQCKNLIIAQDMIVESFLIYDMRTAHKYTYACETGYKIFNWCIYDGNLLFDEYNREEGKDRLRQMDLTTKEIELIYQWEKGKCPEDIRIREDGTITYNCYNAEQREREIWQLKMNKNGTYQETLIWKADNDWEYVYALDFNQFGLVIWGEFFFPQNLSYYERVVITDSGEMIKLDDELSNNCIFMENGYLDGNRAELEKMPWEEGTTEAEYLSFYLADTVSFYDYEGNLKVTYQMVNRKLLEQGYYLKKLTYHNEKITAFYIQSETEQLYISQIKANLDK